MENRVNYNQVIRELMDIVGTKRFGFDLLELHLRNGYCEKYMPETNMMNGDDWVKELSLDYCWQLCYEFRRSLTITGDNMCLRELRTQEGSFFKLLADGVEVWEELERYVLGWGLRHIGQVAYQKGQLSRYIDRLALDMLFYADSVNRARAMGDKKEGEKFLFKIRKAFQKKYKNNYE